MPPRRKTATPVAAPTPQRAEVEEQPTSDREVIYDKVEAEICTGDAAIGESLAKQLLGWETEKEYQARMIAENPGTSEAQWVYGDSQLLVDLEGNKVKCWNNLENRFLDPDWCQALGHTVLDFNWAGPLTIPGETVNGSTVVISRTGRTESGQHSLIGVVFANQLYRKTPEKWPRWATVKNSAGEPMGPCIETIVITGISEHPRVLMTVDNCKARSVADVFYTSPTFRSLTTSARHECSKMMAVAVDFLWNRTGTQGYKTHSEVVAFVDRHPRLVKAVEHIFAENPVADGRPITKLRVSAGTAAALLYLMGASGSKTDGDEYRNGSPPSERSVNWERWDKAKEFWARAGRGNEFTHFRVAMNKLVEASLDNDANIGMGGRMPEKLALVRKAWETFCAHDPEAGDLFTDADLLPGGALVLAYNRLDDQGRPLPDGQIKLLDDSDLRGIDVPEKPKGAPVAESPPPPQTEIEKAAAEQLRLRDLDKLRARLREVQAAKERKASA